MLKNAIKELEKPHTIQEFTKMAVLYHAITEKLYYKWEQITTYDWLTQDSLDKCFKRLQAVATNMTWLYRIKHTYDNISEIGTIHISGMLDAVNDYNVILFTDTITMTQQLQLIIYAFLTNNVNKNYKLFNIITGELLVLNYSSKIHMIVELLLRHKYEERTLMDDQAFIDQTQ
jgi:hypothetical protein